MITVSMVVNGKPTAGDVDARTSLGDFLRDKLNLTGTHFGCEHGVCGACTILVDGAPVRSCITLAVACEGASITTIEGLDDDDVARDLRAAFSREHGLQCGYCTPGMIVSARDIVLRMQAPSERDIRVAMSGNLCRCTGYVGIVRAIQSISDERGSRGAAAFASEQSKRLGPAGSANASSAIGGERRSKAAEPDLASDGLSRPSTALGDSNWKPQTTLTQVFAVDHPVEVVWAYFADIPAVVACLPGASIVGAPVGGRVEGRFKVKVGPISAEFAGAAVVTRDEAKRSGVISGMGRDTRSNSTTRGLITYAVLPDPTPGRTRVELTIGFTLTGMLAQFGRSGLVEDVARRIIAMFSQNLEQRLSGGLDARVEISDPPTEFDAGSMVRAMVLDYVKRAFSWLLRRK